MWLSFRRIFVAGLFQNDVLALPANRRWFRELLGIGTHRVFDCVGTPKETRS